MRKFLMSLISGMGIACATLTGQSDQLEQKVQEVFSNTIVWLRVVNLYGTEMFILNQLNCNGSIHISTGNWPNGVYLVEWVDKNGVNRKIKTLKVN